MSVRNAHDCDRCGAKDLTSWAVIRVKIGVFSDVPSGRTEDDVHEVDLCLQCCAKELKTMVRLMTPDEAKAWVLAMAEAKRGTK